MLPKRSALIVGGSIAGLCAARLLARDGWRVKLFERVAINQSGRGAGIVTHPELFQALAEAGLPQGPDIGFSVTHRRLMGQDGGIVFDMPFPQTLATWATIYSLLRDSLDGVEIHLGWECTGFSDEGDRVVASFADGGTAEGDLIVGADGFRSAIRKHMMPDVVPAYAGYITWRGMVPEAALSENTRRALGRQFCFCLPPGGQIAGYPVRTQDGLAYNYVWYRVADADALKALLTDQTGRHHDLNIPPPLVSSIHIQRMRADADKTLSPQFAEIVQRTQDPFFQPIYDLAAPRLTARRAVLLGDSAFVARPHVGAGVSKALQDASALAAAFRENEDMDIALAAYEAARRPVGAQIVDWARYLGDYLHLDLSDPAGTTEVRKLTEAVLRDTASLHFLRKQTGNTARH